MVPLREIIGCEKSTTHDPSVGYLLPLRGLICHFKINKNSEKLS
jgi:hypothetical protein